MYGLDSLTEHSTVNVEFSRESVSFMWKDSGLGPGKMGRGGKGGKPGGSSKRVETKNIKAFALQNFGILLGFAIMLILALYGETISVK